MSFWGKLKILGFLGFLEKNLNLKNANFGGFWPKIENFEYGFWKEMKSFPYESALSFFIKCPEKKLWPYFKKIILPPWGANPGSLPPSKKILTKCIIIPIKFCIKNWPSIIQMWTFDFFAPVQPTLLDMSASCSKW